MPITIELPVSGFVRRVWMEQGETRQGFLLELFSVLNQAGCDYYELMNLYSEHSFSEWEIKILASYSPVPKAVVPISLQNVRGNIYRWTSSKYSTDRISKVVDDIYRRLLLNQPGMTVYDNNLNPLSKRQANDRYILLITEDEELFLDVSRKATTKFQKG